MYSLLRDDPENELLRDRLGRLLGEIRGLKLATREEYQAEVFSRVNGILALGNRMLPLVPVPAEGPAVVGHLAENFARLNQDAIDIAGQLTRVETSAAQLYNLAVASQNELRQHIREALYASNARRFVEAFIHERQLGDYTTTVDLNAGVAALPLVDETEVMPTIVVGTNSDGEVLVSPEALLDGKIETALVLEGTKLELILTFDKPEIVNRLRFELDDYQGLEITTLSSSPDGSLFEDVLADLNTTALLLNATASKYSGDVIIDFPPRHTKQMRVVIEDKVDQVRIALRSLTVLRRRYAQIGTLTTQPIYLTAGVTRFSTTALDFAPFATVVHQFSTDGVHFVNLTPGSVTLPSPFWYKATLQRSVTAFERESAAVIVTGDVQESPDYRLKRLSTVPLGAGVIERTIILEQITGPVRLRDVPLPNTFKVQQDSVYLTTDQYAFNGGIFSLAAAGAGKPAVPSIIITYQTSALGAAALATRKEFYTPLLYEVRFEA